VKSFGAASPPMEATPRFNRKFLQADDCGAAAETGKSGKEAGRLRLLNFDLGAGLFELLLDGRSFVLVHAFLDGLRSAVNEVLGFFQTEACDFANGLDDVDLVAAHVGENDGELRLLFRRSRTTSRRSASATG